MPGPPDSTAPEPLVHREPFRVRAGEVGPAGLLKLPSLLDLMQEAASNHAEALGRGAGAMTARGTAWVLSRLRLRVHGLPAWRDDVIVETWPSGALRLWALRELRLRDARGDVLAEATTGWLVVKLPSKRPVRPEALISELGRLAPPRVLDDAFGDLPRHSGNAVRLDREIQTPSLPPAAGSVARFRCGRFDLDAVGHANHVVVLRWLLETAGADAWSGGEPSLPLDLEADLRAEVLEGDTLIGRRAPHESGLLVTLEREGDGREAARARLRRDLAGEGGAG